MDDVEFSEVERELETQGGNLILSAGGSYETNYVQLLYLTAEFAAWYEEMRARRYPLDVYCSLVPDGRTNVPAA